MKYYDDLRLFIIIKILIVTKTYLLNDVNKQTETPNQMTK